MDLIAAIILIVLSAVVFLFVGIIIANTINSKRASSQYAQDSYQTPPNDQGTVQNGIEHLFIPKKPSSTSLMCGGVVFAIIAIVLFVLSIKKSETCILQTLRTRFFLQLQPWQALYALSV